MTGEEYSVQDLDTDKVSDIINACPKTVTLLF